MADGDIGELTPVRRIVPLSPGGNSRTKNRTTEEKPDSSKQNHKHRRRRKKDDDDVPHIDEYA